MSDPYSNIRSNVLGAFSDYGGLEQAARLASQIPGAFLDMDADMTGAVFITAMVDEFLRVSPERDVYRSIVKQANRFAEREAREGGRGWTFVRLRLMEMGTEYRLTGASDSAWGTWSPQQRAAFMDMVEEETPRKRGGCYVATAVYGSYDCPEVWVLRRFRDETLMETRIGRQFVRTYYAISPAAVQYGGSAFRFAAKFPVAKLVEFLRSRGVSDQPYLD